MLNLACSKLNWDKIDAIIFSRFFECFVLKNRLVGMSQTSSQ